MAAKNKFMNAMKMPAIADMFSSEADRQRESGDLVTEVSLSELHPFVNHPFEVRDDEDMQKLVDSIKENGVLTNLTVRPRAEGGYEIISGHRRFHAAQLAGLDKIKVQVRDVDDDQAIIDMVDANIQREHISPMEKARAYAMRLEAVKHQGRRTDLTSDQVGPKLTAAEKVAAGVQDTQTQVKRYIRLNSLVPDLQKNEYAGNAVSARYTKAITLPSGANGFQGWYKDGEDAYGNVEWASLLYRMDWEGLYGIVDGIKCRATGSGMTEEELRQLFASLNIDATTARGQVVAFALSCQGKFVYAQPSSLRGGPGSPSVGINLDCSSFVQYCYWAQNLPFSAGSTAAYRNAADLVSISPSEVQPGDLRVVYASGGEQGHVQMALGGGAWIECCYGYGVAVNMSNAWMESRPCYYFRYAGF